VVKIFRLYGSTEQDLQHVAARSSFFGNLSGKHDVPIRAVDDVSLSICYNETLGVVGESGSGKTTLGRTILMLHTPTSGQIFFMNQEISNMDGEALRQIRKNMQIVFQNPYSSLNPRHRVRNILLEAARAYNIQIDDQTLIDKSLKVVGLPPDSLDRLPHQFSGGQRQRIAIARALLLNPRFVVLDEPTSALDSSIQTQILNLLRKIQENYGLSYLFITHNISVVKYMADRVAVMYGGKIVEVGLTRDVVENPFHPYTSALIASVPEIGSKHSSRELLPGETPSPAHPPKGCRFNPRCKFAQSRCIDEEPLLRQVSNSHFAACHFSEQLMGQL
jgi:oligopeptide/dipeptide ABC transporter ATP-binding protein